MPANARTKHVAVGRAALLALLALGGCTALTNPDRFTVGDGSDAGASDAGTSDAGVDAGADRPDASLDAGMDGSTETGLDAGVDAGIDAGPADAGMDAAPGDAGRADAGGAFDAGPPVIGLIDPYEGCLPTGRAVTPTSGDGSCAAPFEIDVSGAMTGELFEMELTGTSTDSAVPDCLSGTSRDFAFNVLVPVDHQLEISVFGPPGTIPRLVSSISAAGVCLPTLFRCRGDSSARCRGIVVQPSSEGSPTSDLVRFLVAEVGAPPSGAPLNLRLHVIPLQDCSAGNPNYCEEFGD